MTNQQPYPAPAYYAPPTNGIGTAAMVLGIIGLIFSFVPLVGVIAWPLVILGAIFGGVGMDKAGKNPGIPKRPGHRRADLFAGRAGDLRAVAGRRRGELSKIRKSGKSIPAGMLAGHCPRDRPGDQRWHSV